MRQGIGCTLFEATPGSLAEVRRSLEAWRFVCRTVAPETGADENPEEILLLDVSAGCGAAQASAVAAQRRAGGATLALCPADEAGALSLAASWGCDDMLAAPLDPVELVRRLQTLANLHALVRERQRRAELFATYRDGSEAAPPSERRPAHRPAVILLGRPGPEQVQLAGVMSAALVTYVRDAAELPRVLRGGEVDLLAVTEPALLEEAIAALETTESEAPMVLAGHAGPPWALELPSQVDLLSLPAPMPIVRCRLELALRMATLRRWLRDPPLAASRSLLVDSLTGLYNHGAFLDYLRMSGEEWALIGLEHDRLEWINRQAGYAAGNLVLAALGRSLRRRIRAHDFAAHLGGGRFAVAVMTADRPRLERLRGRLQATIAEDRPWQILAAAEALPVRGTPPQRLSRLFADLRRLRPAA